MIRLHLNGLTSAAILVLLLVNPVIARDFNYPGCRPYQTSSYSPTGVVGCQVYGTGVASWYSGSAAARNDCVYPWVDCTPIRVTSLDTGRSILVVPAQFCDCYLGDTNRGNDRMVDLIPSQVTALGLNPAAGLFRVRVEPSVRIPPNTAIAP